MTSRNLIVDGMLSGTGIRDSVEGGYVELRELDLSPELVRDIARWLDAYEDAHFHQFGDELLNARLDEQGQAIARRVQTELPRHVIEYYSSALLKKMDLA